MARVIVIGPDSVVERIFSDLTITSARTLVAKLRSEGKLVKQEFVLS